MRNQKGIDDIVKVVLKGEGKENVIGNNEVVRVTNVDEFPDKTILYIGVFHCKCPDGGTGYDSTIQFGEDEYEEIPLDTEE